MRGGRGRKANRREDYLPHNLSHHQLGGLLRHRGFSGRAITARELMAQRTRVIIRVGGPMVVIESVLQIPLPVLGLPVQL